MVLTAVLGERRLGVVAGAALATFGALVLWFAVALMLVYARVVVVREERDLRSVLSRLWGVLLRVGGWLLLNAVVAGSGLVDLAFYMRARSLLVAVMGVFWFYLFVFWVMLQLYAAPGVAAGRGLVRALRDAALLVLDNLGLTAGLVGVLLLVVAATTFPIAARVQWVGALGAALAMFLLPGAAAILGAGAYAGLIESYRSAAAANEGGEIASQN